ncbi:EscG/YscG/SsaH family type III secretion system needle protein co-chaperone [Hafnia alvei]|uniref:Type III secretion system protein, SsaH family n=1 Tax=Hafnia alvei TaxID=569 RepID=A0A1C6YV13_HAFAL|nr:EscG/YscG/SsaH family type III secretion system needle protein co-chaperone [Hafnia alvei]NLS55320.1 EscG/YscG/SsaH family type III secretion system needle protein co-chaperone [Hafnia alvei]SCM50674.1 type III secretion system protein, SsaH family [Hafnia alvei]
MTLTDNERRLLVETAFAGINHGLHRQVRAMLPAVPYLVPDKEMRAVCLAVLLAGLDEPELARQTLVDITLPEAELLRNHLF